MSSLIRHNDYYDVIMSRQLIKSGVWVLRSRSSSDHSALRGGREFVFFKKKRGSWGVDMSACFRHPQHTHTCSNKSVTLCQLVRQVRMPTTACVSPSSRCTRAGTTADAGKLHVVVLSGNPCIRCCYLFSFCFFQNFFRGRVSRRGWCV